MQQLGVEVHQEAADGVLVRLTQALPERVLPLHNVIPVPDITASDCSHTTVWCMIWVVPSKGQIGCQACCTDHCSFPLQLLASLSDVRSAAARWHANKACRGRCLKPARVPLCLGRSAAVGAQTMCQQLLHCPGLHIHSRYGHTLSSTWLETAKRKRSPLKRQSMSAVPQKVKGPWLMGKHPALTSSSESSARRRQRDRMSPTAGPPRTLTISAVLPPSSDTGSTYVTRVVSWRTAPACKCWCLRHGPVLQTLTWATRSALRSTSLLASRVMPGVDSDEHLAGRRQQSFVFELTTLHCTALLQTVYASNGVCKRPHLPHC